MVPKRTLRKLMAEGYKPISHAYLTRMTGVPAKPVSWLWPERIPLGKVTLMVGDPGRGKSLLALDVAARVSRGAPWPDQGEAVSGSEFRVSREEGEKAGAGELETQDAKRETPNRVGTVILLSAEDDLADTIRPRFEAAGGDVERAILLRAVGRPAEADGELMFSLARDVEALESVLSQVPGVRLVVIDPVSAYLAGADANSNTAIRNVLAPLVGVAERAGVAVVAISHLTKKANAALLYRTMGSLAFVAAARAAWAVGPDPAAAVAEEARPAGASGRMLFLPVKCNLVGGATGLAYRIVPSPANPAVPLIAWETGAVPLTAEEGLGVSAGRPSRLDTAAKWLEGLLSRGPLAATDVERMALAAGFSKRTLERARRSLRIATSNCGQGTPWMMRLAGEDEAGEAREKGRADTAH